MRSTSFDRALVLAALCLASSATPGLAQVIGLKTVPLAAGEQFLIFPSENLGMGGVSIALDDALADPFSNPAKGVRATESRVFSVPTFYSITNENGGARTMPFGILARGDRWFGGGMVAIQDLDQGRGLVNWLPPIVPGSEAGLPRPDALAVHSLTNKFAQLHIGKALDDRWAIAVSAMFADLAGTDGVEQLFANAWEIEEFGSVRDVRIGVNGELDNGGRLDVAVVHNRFRMTHDVTTVTLELVDTMNWVFMPNVQEESHKNIGTTWGAQVGYVQPLDAPGWRAGGVLTVNRKDHPKIPTYDLTAVDLPQRPPIPRDPGNSWAYDIGAGIAYEEGPTTFAMDVVYEPAVSDTWADELEDVTAADGSTIPAGDHTVDNHFDFSNARASVGLSHDVRDWWGFQLGVRMRSYSYRMEQQDYVLGLDRSLTQQWTEWTPTWGARFELNGLEVRYTGLASSASHFPFPDLGSSTRDFDFAMPVAAAGGDILAPPSGRLGTPDETVVTHRLQISVPIR